MNLFQIKKKFDDNSETSFVVFGLPTHTNSHQSLPLPFPKQVMILVLEFDFSKNRFAKDVVLK